MKSKQSSNSLFFYSEKNYVRFPSIDIAASLNTSLFFKSNFNSKYTTPFIFSFKNKTPLQLYFFKIIKKLKHNFFSHSIPVQLIQKSAEAGKEINTSLIKYPEAGTEYLEISQKYPEVGASLGRFLQKVPEACLFLISFLSINFLII